jgi:hypothetical protein
MMRGTLICLGLLMASTSAQAENLRVGADVAVVMPVGNWGDVSSIGIGGMAKGEFLVMENLAVTGRLGYIYHLEKDIAGFPLSTAEVPIMFGAKFYFMGEPSGLYGAAELGLVSLSVSSSFLGATVTASEMKFGATVGAGFDLSGLDFRAQLFLPSLADAGDFLGIMATVGYAVTIF